ncbi:hypothetical protein [Streptomyces coryli]|uniref:hypothetical protein n=1 Tax=Streptomyces coryli TaxID=1128680 RepID=UPI0019D2A3A0|nr:hypothetical protein [Streptomyces coryli]
MRRRSSLLAAVLLGTVLATPARADASIADCRTNVTGDTVTARCHNPNGTADRVQLHVECAEWWDPDTDSRAVTLNPSQGREFRGRCWFGIARAWVSHAPR